MKNFKMMKKYIFQWFAVIPFLAFSLASCDKYLDIQPKGKRLLKTVDDFDLWLNSEDLAYSIPNAIYLLADNVDNPTIPYPITEGTNWVYTWRQQFSAYSETSPIIWKDLYKAIYYYNTVLNNIDEATGDTGQKESLKAEAQLGRAFHYLYLVNLYGKSYDPNTADEDLAVPFVTSNDLNEPTPDRSTVQEIYDYIVADLTAAIPDLPGNNDNNRFRGSVAAAYSVLARTYLYMGDYTKAAQNAQLALDNGQNAVLDYSELSSSLSIGEMMTRPGVIYANISTSYYILAYPTLDFLRTFNTKDLRLAFYYYGLGDYSFQTREEACFISMSVSFSRSYPNWGTSVEEMRLILAEAAARANDLPTAIEQLDKVRKCRFKAEDYVKYDPANPVQEDVLQQVLTERTFEFAFNGMRWFDMRRLDAEGRMPEVKRYDGQGNVIATLPSHSNKYTLQIPLQILYFHPDWPQNPWDEE
jgi:hypothetical protein